jgi:hypothetical protein
MAGTFCAPRRAAPLPGERNHRRKRQSVLQSSGEVMASGSQPSRRSAPRQGGRIDSDSTATTAVWAAKSFANWPFVGAGATGAEPPACLHWHVRPQQQHLAGRWPCSEFSVAQQLCRADAAAKRTTPASREHPPTPPHDTTPSVSKGKIATANQTATCDAQRNRREVLTLQFYCAGGWGSKRLAGSRPLPRMLLPIIILGVAPAEREHGVGQLSPLPVAGMNADQQHPVVVSLNLAGVKFRGVHGGTLQVGRGR